MEAFVTKQEEKLYRALQKLLTHSVDRIGLPKKATIKQLRQASKALTDYEKHERANPEQLHDVSELLIDFCGWLIKQRKTTLEQRTDKLVKLFLKNRSTTKKQ